MTLYYIIVEYTIICYSIVHYTTIVSEREGPSDVRVLNLKGGFDRLIQHACDSEETSKDGSLR